jgi:hypothetical protein
MTSFSLNIEVTFIDELTEESLGVTQIAANNLPDVFEKDTTINLSGVDWNVLNSRPKTRAQYTKSKQLILWIRRVEDTSESDILYNLPSICKKFPDVTDLSLTGNELVLAEDDWRQFEFISNTFAAKVDKNIAQIQRIHDNAKDGMGWRELYLRSKPEIPISNNIALTYLASMLQVSAKSAGITYDGSQSPIKEGYSFTLNDDFSVYGIAPKGKIQVIAIGQDCNVPPNEDSIDLLQQLARKFNFDLVHWCRCLRLHPDDPLFRSVLAKLD